MLSPQMYGAGTKLMGKKVDKQLDVKLNDKMIGQAAVIEGISYITVRAFANEYQLAVDSKTITLSLPSAEKNAKIAHEQQAEIDKTAQINSLTKAIKSSKEKIKNLEDAIASGERTVSDAWSAFETVNNNAKASNDLKKERKQIFNTAVAALDTTKAALDEEQQNIAKLQAQLAELQGE